MNEQSPIDIRKAVFPEVVSYHQAEQRIERGWYRAGWWVGAAGAAVGVLGMACAAAAMLYLKPVVRYTTIDTTTGIIRDSFGAADAPQHFSETVIERALADYINLRERFVWQLDPVSFHLVTLMSSPEEQKRYVADRAREDPAHVYGMNGYARVTHFYPPFKRRGAGRDGTLEYEVHFDKSAVTAANPGKVETKRMTVYIAFQFHPELAMNDQDRLANETGLYVVSYNPTAD